MREDLTITEAEGHVFDGDQRIGGERSEVHE
jgi:hypothetical protein